MIHQFKVSIPMKKKSETFSAYLKFEAYAENPVGDTIKASRRTRDGEFMSKELKTLTRKGLCVDTLCVKRPQQNGSAENGNKVIGKRITSMLAEANLPMQFW